MSANNWFEDFDSREQLVLEAQRMVRWAAEPVEPGESIGAQVLKASRELRLHYGVVRRAWYRLSGPEIYPTIRAAHIALVERRHTELLRQQQSPWRNGSQQLRGVLVEGRERISQPSLAKGNTNTRYRKSSAG